MLGYDDFGLGAGRNNAVSGTFCRIRRPQNGASPAVGPNRHAFGINCRYTYCRYPSWRAQVDLGIPAAGLEKLEFGIHICFTNCQSLPCHDHVDRAYPDGRFRTVSPSERAQVDLAP